MGRGSTKNSEKLRDQILYGNTRPRHASTRIKLDPYSAGTYDGWFEDHKGCSGTNYWVATAASLQKLGLPLGSVNQLAGEEWEDTHAQTITERLLVANYIVEKIWENLTPGEFTYHDEFNAYSRATFHTDDKIEAEAYVGHLHAVKRIIGEGEWRYCSPTSGQDDGMFMCKRGGLLQGVIVDSWQDPDQWQDFH